jgi:hypothetical protein
MCPKSVFAGKRSTVAAKVNFCSATEDETEFVDIRCLSGVFHVGFRAWGRSTCTHSC